VSSRPAAAVTATPARRARRVREAVVSGMAITPVICGRRRR
jgi:hypothetical protein